MGITELLKQREHSARALGCHEMLKRIYENAQAIQGVGGEVLGWRIDQVDYLALERLLDEYETKEQEVHV